MNNVKPWKKYPLIANELEEVNRFIQTTIKTPHHSLQALYLKWLTTEENIYVLAFFC